MQLSDRLMIEADQKIGLSRNNLRQGVAFRIVQINQKQCRRLG
jgi:hypothetical protein